MSLMPTATERPAGRSFLLDAIKASGCVLIVLHHLAFYGPMSDVVATGWPTAVSWLYDHGRLAVQFFLVCAGFLTAGHLARYEFLDLTQALALAWQRYLRLAIPLLAALSVTVLVTEGLRPEFAHASLSDTPQWGQALAHIVLLQHLLDLEALSAGIWYVAIDFQLYAMTLISLLLVQACRSSQPQPVPWLAPWVLWLGLTCASLWWWNLLPDWDDHGLYFFGAYGLGLLAWQARQRLSPARSGDLVQRVALGVGWLILGGVSWWLEPRWRLAVAWAVATLLISVPAGWFSGEAVRSRALKRLVQWLSKVSYSVFLIHFAVALLVNASVTAQWPEALWVNLLGMLGALLLSLLAGALLYQGVERHAPSGRRWWLWVGIFKLSVAMSWLMSPLH